MDEITPPPLFTEKQIETMVKGVDKWWKRFKLAFFFILIGSLGGVGFIFYVIAHFLFKWW